METTTITADWLADWPLVKRVNIGCPDMKRWTKSGANAHAHTSAFGDRYHRHICFQPEKLARHWNDDGPSATFLHEYAHLTAQRELDLKADGPVWNARRAGHGPVWKRHLNELHQRYGLGRVRNRFTLSVGDRCDAEGRARALTPVAMPAAAEVDEPAKALGPLAGSCSCGRPRDVVDRKTCSRCLLASRRSKAKARAKARRPACPPGGHVAGCPCGRGDEYIGVE